MIAAGNNVAVSVATVYNGAAYTADGASYRVWGPGDTVLQDWTAVAGGNIGAGSINQVINSTLNALSGTNTQEARLIEFTVTCAASFAGSQRLTTSYAISLDTALPLVLMTNSFQAYTDALTLASTMLPELPLWSVANMDTQISTMEAAYNFLSRLNYEIYYDYDDVYFKARADWGLPYQQTVGRLYDYTAEQFLALDPDFIQCIQKAQLVEADERLVTDTAEKRRLEGVLSETAGESSTMFRAGKPLQLMVSRRALKYMSGYLKYGLRTTRS